MLCCTLQSLFWNFGRGLPIGSRCAFGRFRGNAPIIGRKNVPRFELRRNAVRPVMRASRGTWQLREGVVVAF
jgi:hypothetical protein